jgi:peptidoglycan/xylan/chitin deacetylase (PgdA/CDA1 family)
MRLLSEPAARAVGDTALGSLLMRLPRTSVVVLAYHRVGVPQGDDDPDLWSATQEQLSEQIRFLRKHFDVVAPSEIPAVVRSGSGHHAAITFDDGYRDNYELALPVLSAHGVRAGFFITAEYIGGGRLSWWDEIAALMRNGRRRELPASEWLPKPLDLAGDRAGATRTAIELYKLLPRDRARAFLEYLRDALGDGEPMRADTERFMSWDMVRDLHAAGMEIGGHTLSHPVLAGLSGSEQWHEIAGCAERLEAEVGTAMRIFSYPVGRPESYDDSSRACLRRLGVQAAFTCHGGVPDPQAFDPLAIPRVPIAGNQSPARVRARITMPTVFARR